MEKLRGLIIQTVRHELISGSFYVFIGVTASSFFAFLLNIYIARNLSYSDYGIFASIMSLITLLAIPSASISAVIVRFATLFFSKKEDAKAGAFYIKSFKYLLIFNFFLSIAFIAFFPLISDFLKINDLGLMVLAIISVALFYMATLNVAFLQSLLKFRLLGLLYSFAGIGKLFGGVILIIMGLKVYGALLATFIFSLIDYVFSFIPLKKVISKAGKDVSISRREFTYYAIPTSIAIFSLSSFISTDVILVKHFFSSSEAGFYGGLSLIGKVVFYFTGPIPMAMFPLIVKRHTNQENFNNLFYIALVIVLIPSVLITIFYFVFPEFTIRLFLGREGYISVAPYLGLFGILLTIYSINNVFVNFFLSIKKTLVSLIVLFFALLQIILIYIYHDNFSQIIYVSIISSVLLLGSLMIYYLKLYGPSYKKE